MTGWLQTCKPMGSSGDGSLCHRAFPGTGRGSFLPSPQSHRPTLAWGIGFVIVLPQCTTEPFKRDYGWKLRHESNPESASSCERLELYCPWVSNDAELATVLQESVKGICLKKNCDGIKSLNVGSGDFSLLVQHFLSTLWRESARWALLKSVDLLIIAEDQIWNMLTCNTRH